MTRISPFDYVAGVRGSSMMKEVKQKLTLDRPATYQIRVLGELDESWSDWAGGDDDHGRKRGRWTAGHYPDRRRRRPVRFAGPVALALLPGLAVDFGQLCRKLIGARS
jgi:hypothetical protein